MSHIFQERNTTVALPLYTKCDAFVEASAKPDYIESRCKLIAVETNVSGIR